MRRLILCMLLLGPGSPLTGCGLLEKTGDQLRRVLDSQRENMERVAVAASRAAVDAFGEKAEEIIARQVSEIGRRLDSVVADNMDRALVSVRGRMDELVATGTRKMDEGREDDLTLLEILAMIAAGQVPVGVGFELVMRKRLSALKANILNGNTTEATS